MGAEAVVLREGTAMRLGGVQASELPALKGLVFMMFLKVPSVLLRFSSIRCRSSVSGRYWNSMGSLSSRSDGRRSCMWTRTGACKVGSAYGGVRNTIATCLCTSACEKDPRASQPGPVKHTSMSSFCTLSQRRKISSPPRQLPELRFTRQIFSSAVLGAPEGAGRARGAPSGPAFYRVTSPASLAPRLTHNLGTRGHMQRPLLPIPEPNNSMPLVPPRLAACPLYRPTLDLIFHLFCYLLLPVWWVGGEY